MATVDTTTVTLTVNGREVTVAKGLSLVEAAAEAGIEIPVFCYEPRLGAGVGACRMCLCEIEGMPKLQTACTTPAGRRHGGRLALGARPRGPGRRARVPAPQPSARLPGVRQGRRVPAPGPDVPLRPRRHADADPEAHAREADPDLAAHQARPRALHPLLPVHPLLGGRLGRHAARAGEPRRALDHHDLRGPAVRERVLRQRHGAVPRRGAHLVDLPVPRPPVGDAAGPERVRPLRRRLQHRRQHPRGARGARALAQPPRDRRGLALRQGPLRVRPAGERPSGSRTASSAAAAGSRRWRSDDALDHVADRLRATVERFGPGSVAVLASGEQTNEEAHAWARLLDEGLGGGVSVCGPEGGAGWEALAPVRGLDRRPRGRRRHRRRRRHRPDPQRARRRAPDPEGRAGRRAGRDGRRGRHAPRDAARRPPRLRRPRHGARRAAPSRRPTRASCRPPSAIGGDRDLGGADAARDRRRPGPRRPRARLDGASNAARRQRARLPGRRPRIVHAGRGARGGRGGPHQGDRPARRRPGRGLAQRRAVARRRSAARSSRSR